MGRSNRGGSQQTPALELSPACSACPAGGAAAQLLGRHGHQRSGVSDRPSLRAIGHPDAFPPEPASSPEGGPECRKEVVQESDHGFSSCAVPAGGRFLSASSSRQQLKTVMARISSSAGRYSSSASWRVSMASRGEERGRRLSRPRAPYRILDGSAAIQGLGWQIDSFRPTGRNAYGELLLLPC